MKVKITSCQNDKYWYANRIGEIVEVTEIPTDDYWYECTEAGETTTRYVFYKDCQEVLSSKESDTMSNVPGGDPAYLQLLEDMRQLHIKKNAGYSGDSVDRWANFRLAETFGVSTFLGVMVRMSDKWIRITNLIKNPSFDQVGESIDDTLFDLAAYALIAICIRREKKEK